MKTRLILILLILTALLAAGSASAATWHNSNTRLAHALPDECYAGVGIDYPGGITPGDGYETEVVCPEKTPNPNYDSGVLGSPEFLPVYKKTNDSYVWALTEEGDSYWFSSAANVMCTTAGVFLGALTEGQTNIRVDSDDQFTETGKVMWRRYLREGEDGSPVCGRYEDGVEVLENCRQENRFDIPYNVCEHENSQPVRDSIWPEGSTGDWRPSKVFRYIKEGLNEGDLINLTQQIYAAGQEHQDAFDSLLGIRCAGSHNGVVFFAGGDQALNVQMFAFNANTGLYLGYSTLPDARQIRKMLVVNDYLYVGLAGGPLGGQVRRWSGSLANPHSWVTVGNMLVAVTEIAQYVDNSGGIHVVANAGAGLYVSPAINPILGGLTVLDAWSWENVWSYSSYDPDSLNITGPGGVGQLGEWVYWGTMHIPYIGYYMNAVSIYDGIENVPSDVQTAMYYATFRTTSIWRGRNLGQANQEIQLVYGEEYLGDYVGGTWQMIPTGWTPLNPGPPYTNPIFGTPVGSSGFYNYNNNYSWVVTPFTDPDGNQHLFWGTMDQTLINNSDISNLKDTNYQFPPNDPRGADMWRFSIAAGGGGWGGATDTVAAPEFTNGASNLFQYGVRCLIASDDGQKLVVGMANNGSLMHPGVNIWGAEPRDQFQGGWELRELERIATP